MPKGSQGNPAAFLFGFILGDHPNGFLTLSLAERVNLPTPAIVPQSAVRRLPRWALVLLCLAYIVPGFVGRDPWRGADMSAFGYMLELAQGHSRWSTPLLAGMGPETDGLLPYWLGAWALQLAPAGLSPELAVRIPFAGLLALTLAATWFGAYYLARSPLAQPVAFAFGGEANPVDYARAMADGALLALVACLGLAQPSHETTSYLTQLCCTALLFFALAAAPYRLRAAALAMAAGLAGLVLSGAPALALVYGAIGAVLYWFCSPNNAIQPRNRMRALALGILLLAGTAATLAWALDLWRWRIDSAYTGNGGWQSFARLLLWFTWPAWPLALWTLWRWRRQLASTQLRRHLLLPLAFVAVALGAALATKPADRALLLGLPPLAVLAAFALPTLRRSVSALIDWFTLLFFTVSAIAIWVVWISTQTGVPAKPAANVAKLAPGFVPEFSLLAFAVALAATVGWCLLVAWRTGRHRAAIWKSLVLPAAGATLGWLLLLTLWLPMLNYARSDAPQVRALLAPVDAQPAFSCAVAYGLGRNQVAALQYHGGLRMKALQDGALCDWLVTTQPLREYATLAQGQWQMRARAARPTDRDDLLLLYQRSPQPSSP